ncbi:MAG: 23S rRNA (uracil(1939)-C(5))-methyltransferase RlmD [Lachnospiraceae bacterium]
MKKGEILTGIVNKFEFPNKGNVVSSTGEVCVVKNALPGQEVKIRVKKVRKGKGQGQLLEVIEKSPKETESPCPHYGICGGCTYISFPYEEQCNIKKNQVKELLDTVLQKQEQPYIYEGIKSSPLVYEYRNKMEFSFGDEIKDGPLSLGMHKRGSFYDIVTVDSCKIVDEDYRKILKTTLEYFKERNVSFYHKLSHVGYLRHLLVRKATNTSEILIALVTTTQEELDLNGFKNAILSCGLEGKIAGILHVKNDSLADVVKSDDTVILYGQDYFYEELLSLRFKITPFSFFQTNSKGAEVLYETVREYIKDSLDSNTTIYDLYSGTGTIAQVIAPIVKKVIGVEIVEEAVISARKNASLNQLDNCEFIAGDVLKIIDEIKEQPDFIILDPPRDGIHPKALEKIIAFNMKRLVYISCKPTSLVRDLEVFLERGYIVEKAVAVDQFPWTANVETVCLLSKLN